MNTAPESLSGELSEPALDLIDPRCRSRREVDMIMWTTGEPRLDLGRLVGGVVVHDDMDAEPFGHMSVDLLEEVQELDRPVSLVAFADDEARCDVERCEQRCRAVPHVTVRPAFGHARHHRQDRLLAIERLDLAFLVNAKDKDPVGWREV